MKCYIHIICLLLTRFQIGSLFAQPAETWEKLKDENGIAIYIDDSSITHIKKYRAITEVNATLTEITNLFMDIDSYDQWMDGVDYAKIIERENDSTYIQHSYIKIPIISDRDVVARVSIRQDHKTKIVNTMAIAKPEMDKEPDYIRLVVFKSGWTFTPLAKNKTKITYNGIVDVKNQFTFLFIGRTIVNNLHNTLTNMRKQSEIGLYKLKSLSFIKEKFD